MRRRVPLVLAGMAIVPVVAFAFLWATLLLMLAMTWLLEKVGFF